MATRKQQLASSAAIRASADPAHAAEHAQGAAHPIPAAAGQTASERAYGPASETGEMQQLGMQMSMDRMNKADQTTSNISHKMGETADNITDNLK